MIEVTINIGGVLLDTDEGTQLGMAYHSRWLFGDGGAKRRSFDMSVPVTVHNDNAFAGYQEPARDGVRQRIAATVVAGGVLMNGLLYVTNCSNGRYQILFVTGNIFEGFDNVPNWRFPDTLTVRDKETPVTGGIIPSFGFYQYDNGTFNGVVSPPVSLFPTANLGYIIDTLAAAAGWTVVYPPAVMGRRYQAAAYGLILPTMRVYNDNTVNIDGSGVGGWNVTVQGGGTLANCGLAVQTRRYKRGNMNENKTVHTFTALRPVKVVFEESQGVVVAGGQGYDIYNNWNGQRGCEIDMQTGDWFTVVSPQDWHWVGGRASNKWNGTLNTPRGYETQITAVFSTHEDAGVASSNSVIKLSLNLPDMKLKEYLDAYCDVICATWEADDATKIITVTTLEELLSNLDNWLELDNEKVVSIGDAKRYIDGWSQHNYVVFKSADNVPDWARFRRDYPVVNDYLEKEREVAVVPFNDGEWAYDANGKKTVFLDDVTLETNGEMNYKGVLTLVYENNGGNTGALHVQTVNDEGLGELFGAFTRSAMSLEVDVVMPMMRFAQIDELKAVTFRGRSFVVEGARWAGGICTLCLLSVSI